MRKTHASRQVAAALIADPNGQHWGYQLSKTTGIRSGVLYPIIHRMLDEGWLSDSWELGRHGRPRRCYRVTEEGVAACTALLTPSTRERGEAGG